MDFIMIIFWILFVILLYLLHRNNRTLKLRLWFIDNHWDLYNKLPDYDEMLFSFKPLSKNYWLKRLENK